MKLDSERLIMTPPLLPSPAAIAAAKADWQTQARRQYDSGAWMLGLDDERRMSDDFDFHPQTLDGFRRWLAGRYADIAALNKSWGSSFADFSQVVPKRRKELGDSPNLAPWLEFRMFIGEVLGDHYMQAPAQWAEEISPDLAVCEWGIYEPSVTWPVDWRRYAAAYKVTTRYGGNQGVLEELFRSFAPRTRHGLWMGYGMMSADAGRRIDPWRSLLNGGVFSFFWEMRDPGSLNYAVLTSDQRPTAGYAVLGQEEFPDLTGGIDRLILASRFTDDKIAVAYSYPSWLADSVGAGRPGQGRRGRTRLPAHVRRPGRRGRGPAGEGGLQAAGDPAGQLCLARADRRRAAVCRAGRRRVRGPRRLARPARHAARRGPLGDALTGVRTGRATPLGRIMAVRAGEQTPARCSSPTKTWTLNGRTERWPPRTSTARAARVDRPPAGPRQGLLAEHDAGRPSHGPHRRRGGRAERRPGRPGVGPPDALEDLRPHACRRRHQAAAAVLRRRPAGVRHRDVVLPDAFRPLAAGRPLPGAEDGRAADRPHQQTSARLRGPDAKYLGHSRDLAGHVPRRPDEALRPAGLPRDGRAGRVAPGPHKPGDR